jgi:DUF971 family protein
VKPSSVQQIQNELAILWDDGGETYIPLERVRRFCPCAACAGEQDVLGNTYKGISKPLGPQSFQLNRVETVGGYALNFQWGDGHGSGLYPYPLLRKLGEIAD